MSRTRKSIAQEIQAQLIEAEHRSDLSMIATADLLATIVRGGMAIGASAVFTQTAVDGAFAALETVAAGRRKIVDTHHILADIKKVVLPTVDVGGSEPKDGSQFVKGELSLVEGGADLARAA